MNRDLIFYTHNNGSRPFKVVISKRNLNKNLRGKRVRTKYDDSHYQIEIFSNQDDYDEDIFEEVDSTPEHHHIATFLSKKIFIGRSPLNSMTEYSGNFGPNYNGNSILVELDCDEKEYLFIGHTIFSFQTLFPLIEYFSPVGNNDIPYPYAIDSEGNYYLLIENVILSNTRALENYVSVEENDPYSYFYRYNLIKNFENISEVMVGEEKYILRYHPNPSEDYNCLTTKGEEMYLIYKNGERKRILKEDYIDLIERFGRKMSFTPLEIQELI